MVLSFASKARRVSVCLFLASLLLSGCTQPPPRNAQTARVIDTRLGTTLGEDVASQSSNLNLRRANQQPVDMAVLHYSAAKPLGARVPELMLANGQVGMRILHDDGASWPIYRNDRTTALQGQNGERYAIEYRNHSKTTTYEIVATVDGLDVLSGQRGSIRNRGYVLRPGTTIRIDGFRKNSNEVAAFRFGRAEDSFAAKSAAGSIANVGVIGTAVFDLIIPAKVDPIPPSCTDMRCAFPGDGKTASK